MARPSHYIQGGILDVLKQRLTRSDGKMQACKNDRPKRTARNTRGLGGNRPAFSSSTLHTVVQSAEPKAHALTNSSLMRIYADVM